MGYMNPAGSQEPLWQLWRDEFPVTERLVYLNHAAVSPLARRASEAMKHLAEDACLFGSFHYDQWLATYEGLREAAARLTGSDRSEMAIVKNTSEGIATVALGIDWKPGDKVVAFREEFPANYFPWLRLEAKGVLVDWLSIEDPPEVIESHCRGARLLAISFVNYLSGYRVDLETLGEICSRHGCFFFVDAIQGLGAYPLDVRKARIDALAADGHKWLVGPEGCGILYIKKDLQDTIEPVEFGWTNTANYTDYASRDMRLRPDAGRYECGTLNTIGCYGLRAAIELLNEVGVANIASAVDNLAQRVAEGAARKGYELLAERKQGTGSGIVSLRKPDVDSRMVVSELRRKGFITAPRQGWVRVSPHFYISPEDIDRLLAELP